MAWATKQNHYPGNTTAPILFTVLPFLDLSYGTLRAFYIGLELELEWFSECLFYCMYNMERMERCKYEGCMNKYNIATNLMSVSRDATLVMRRVPDQRRVNGREARMVRARREARGGRASEWIPRFIPRGLTQLSATRSNCQLFRLRLAG